MKTKLKLLPAALAFTLVLACYAQPVQTAGQPEETQEGAGGPLLENQDPVYRVTISFNKNGGKGSMDSQIIQSDKETELSKNAFTRKGFQFAGWSETPDGSGAAYKDQENAGKLASRDNSGKKLVLYAQWKLNKPVIKSVKSQSPGNITVAYQKNSGAEGFEIQYAASSSFKKALEAESGSGTSKAVLSAVPGKKYYIRMRSFYKSGNTKKYSNWSSTRSIKAEKGSTIANTESWMSIEADVKLKGSGTGCHAKLVMATPHSAVSYGIQYDKHAEAPYTGKAMAMIENVSTNDAGGQRYSRPGNKSLKLNKTYHLMMSIDKKGNGSVYLDYKKIGGFSQPNLGKEACYLRIEASARLNGDSVDAVFSNIKCKWDGTFDPGRVLGQNLNWTEFNQNPGLKYTVQKNGSIRMYGTVQGITGDWDSAYDKVSEILQFN